MSWSSSSSYSSFLSPFSFHSLRSLLCVHWRIITVVSKRWRTKKKKPVSCHRMEQSRAQPLPQSNRTKLNQSNDNKCVKFIFYFLFFYLNTSHMRFSTGFVVWNAIWTALMIWHSRTKRKDDLMTLNSPDMARSLFRPTGAGLLCINSIGFLLNDFNTIIYDGNFTYSNKKKEK